MHKDDEKYKPCEVISWYRFEELARSLADTIRESNYQPDMIIGICRGGYLPARLLADYFGIMDLASIKIEHYHAMRKHDTAVIRYPLAADVSGKRLLLVDDVSDSGDTFDVAMEHIRQCGAFAQLKTAVLHHKATSTFIPDYRAATVVKWRWLIYPWAVTEDLASFIDAEILLSMPVETIREQLFDHHGISASARQIQSALQLLRHNLE